MSRFYGGDPMQWLERTPLAVVESSLEQLPRLQAEESLATVDRLAIGSGAVKASAARSRIRQWQRQAGAGRRTARRVASRAQLAMLGIGYTEAPPRD